MLLKPRASVTEAISAPYATGLWTHVRRHKAPPPVVPLLVGPGTVHGADLHQSRLPLHPIAEPRHTHASCLSAPPLVGPGTVHGADLHMTGCPCLNCSTPPYHSHPCRPRPSTGSLSPPTLITTGGTRGCKPLWTSRWGERRRCSHLCL